MNTGEEIVNSLVSGGPPRGGPLGRGPPQLGGFPSPFTDQLPSSPGLSPSDGGLERLGGGADQAASGVSPPDDCEADLG